MPAPTDENQNPLDPRPTPRTRPIPIALLILAAPIVASMASRTAMSWVDFVMVSHLGEAAQAAIVPAGIMLFCLISFGFGLLSVVSTLASQSLGRGDPTRCGAWAWQGLWLSLAWALLMAPLTPLVDPLIDSFGHDPDVTRMEADYLRVGLWGVFPAVASAALSAFFQGVHRPWPALWATIAGNAFNVVANYALIYGHWGFPELGVAGAAWGTNAGAAVQLLVLMAFLLAPRFRHEFGLALGWRPQPAKLLQMLRVGGPAGAQLSADIVNFTLFLTLVVGRFGVSAVAGSNIAFKYFELAIVPIVGVSMAATAAVGRAIGAGDLARARATAYWAWAISLAVVGTASLAYCLLGHTLVGWLTPDPNTAHHAVRVLWCLAIFQLFDCTQFTFAGVLKGAGDTLWPAVVMFACSLLIMLAGGWAIATWAPHWGVVGPWAAATVAFAIVALCFALRFRSGRWESIELDQP
ncbi:MAG: MATE family efflux transporter [Planctomycetota bacterium]